MGLAGKEAVMAWKIETGAWNKVALDGLCVAVVVKAEGTLGSDGVFPMRAGKMAAVIIVDARASAEQRSALIAFAKDNAKEYTQRVINVVDAPITLENDHLEGKGVFSAGKLASIETRKLGKRDCICTNESIFYQPLTKVENFSPAYSLKLSTTVAGSAPAGLPVVTVVAHCAPASKLRAARPLDCAAKPWPTPPSGSCISRL
jgi:hypothetical protein